MPKTHEELIWEREDRLHKALITPSAEELKLLFDQNFVYINEFGQVFKGMRNMPIIRDDYEIYSIEVLSRDITFFNSVAVTTTLEIRHGRNDGYEFITKIRLTRIWKFDGRKWLLINGNAVSC